MNEFDVEIAYSNKGLLPWEGGCLWAREDKKPLIQLRKVFENRETFLGIYSKQEILDHELIHARRLHIDGPIFEEVLAYQTSKFAFRRYFGPLFRSSKESLFFLLSSLTLFLTPWLYFGVTSFFLIRLINTQRIFKRAKNNLGFDALLLLNDTEITEASLLLKIIKK